jgi:3-hydroxybutyryl-CoA dehydrogenase
MHYFHPALVMKLVEIVQGPHTSDRTTQALMAFAHNTGKTPILLTKEIEGFVVNRILRAIKDELIFWRSKVCAHP